jgi:hypothetical protein
MRGGGWQAVSVVVECAGGSIPLPLPMKGFIMTSACTLVRLAVASLLLATAGTAAADPAGSAAPPLCPEAFTDIATPAACTLRVENPGFEAGDMGSWLGFDADSSSWGVNLVGPDRDGLGHAAILRGPSIGIQQVVPLPRNPGHVGGHEGDYALRFRLASDGHVPVKLRYRLRFVDDRGVTFGYVTEGEVATDGGAYVHLGTSLKRDLPEAATLNLELYRGVDEAPGLAAYVDDVSIVVSRRR